MSRIVHVDLPGRAYDVEVGAGLLQNIGARLAPMLPRPRVAVVADEGVAEHHLSRLETALTAAGLTCEVLRLPPGEATKSWASLERTVEWLLAAQVERQDVVVAFGGGVIGDLVGFAAAILRRGVRFVQIPTTLLAQVDSSVGGKTGINSSHGKNLVGAFHQPVHVVADTALLDTLPRRDFLSGYGEVAKYGLLGDAGFFAWLEAHGPEVLSGAGTAREEAVTRCVAMKARIVERDEAETGERALLNLGHTFGHALEAATGYSDRLLHGEGVSIGCALAFDLSARLGLCSVAEATRVRAHLGAMGMRGGLADIPGDLPPAKRLVELMMQDKKVRAGRLRFILATGIGEAFVAEDVDLAAVETMLAEALARRAA